MNNRQKYYLLKDVAYVLYIITGLNFALGLCFLESITLIPTLFFCSISLLFGIIAFVVNKLCLYYRNTVTKNEEYVELAA